MEATLPPVALMPELDNSNSYKQYRFMSDMAAARAVAAGDVEFKKIVPWTQYLTVVGYTPQELETVRLACEQSGISFEMLNTNPSKEPDWVNTLSTVMPFHMSEHKRSNAKLTGLFESNDKQVLVIYPGRFQPLHSGHQAVFQQLQEEFGDNVYIATSDKTDGERSPFDYNDKTVMARAANIPLDKVVQVKSPYSPSEITKMFDPNTTVLIFVVGGKDMDLDPRFKFDDKKDGTKSYLQKFKDDEVAEPMSKHGYIMSAPTVEFELLGAPITSATQVRKLYADSDDAKRDKILKDLYGKNSAEIRTMFDRKLGGSSSQLSESAHSDSFIDNMRKFFAIAQRDLELDSLPEIVWTSASTANGERPTFGKFQNDTNTITVSIVNRHPIDIMRTLAHELTHYKQQLTKGLNADSGETGSPEEDEANAVAGQIMRHFDEENPDAFNIKPIIAESSEYGDLSYDPTDEFDKKDLVNVLYKYKDTFPAKDWDIVERLIMDGESTASVARYYNNTPSNIDRIYYKTMHKLQRIVRSTLGADINLYNLSAKPKPTVKDKSKLYNKISNGYELWLSIKNNPELKVVEHNNWYNEYQIVPVTDPRPALTPNVDRLHKILEFKKEIDAIKLDYKNNRINHDKFKQSLYKLEDEMNLVLSTPWYNAQSNVNEEVWDHPNPFKKQKQLRPADKASAKRRAKAAGRKYPNMVDNIWAARR
jgi:hypothetical protein